MDELDLKLLNALQQNFPLLDEPFAAIADELALSVSEVISRLNQLHKQKVISRFGAVFNHKKAGASILMALSVDEQQLEDVALGINKFTEVNHNYQREHAFNLWFVVTATSQAELETVTSNILSQYPWPYLILPMQKDYFINLAFPLV